MVLANLGVILRVMAAATIRRRTVPQAMGRMRPFGFSKGITRAEAIASCTVGVTCPVVRWRSEVASAVLACGLALTMA